MSRTPSKTPDDPRAARIAELLDRVEDGTVSDAEREELALYIEDEPKLEARIAARENARAVGGEWLVRARADQAIEAAESAPLVRAERGVGVAMVIGGFVLSPFVPALSGLAMLGGTALLAWSFLRTRIKSFKNDPYKNIDK